MKTRHLQTLTTVCLRTTNKSWDIENWAKSLWVTVTPNTSISLKIGQQTDNGITIYQYFGAIIVPKKRAATKLAKNASSVGFYNKPAPPHTVRTITIPQKTPTTHNPEALLATLVLTLPTNFTRPDDIYINRAYDQFTETIKQHLHLTPTTNPKYCGIEKYYVGGHHTLTKKITKRNHT